MTTTTTITTWTRLFGETFESGYDADPDRQIEMTDEQRACFLTACRTYLITRVDAILAPYGMEILGDGEIIGIVGDSWTDLTDEDWDEIREEIGMIDFDWNPTE